MFKNVHDVFVATYLNDVNSRAKLPNAELNAKPMTIQSKPKPSSKWIPKPSYRWKPTGRMTEAKDTYVYIHDVKTNNQELESTRFPSSTSLFGRLLKFVFGSLDQVVPHI